MTTSSPRRPSRCSRAPTPRRPSDATAPARPRSAGSRARCSSRRREHAPHARAVHHRSMRMDLVEFAGWRDCLRLTDGAIELIVTTAIGPRIISARLAGGENLLWVDPATAGQTGGDEWHAYGGHRLWMAPETLERTYVPDNGTAQSTWDGTTLRVSATEPRTGI